MVLWVLKRSEYLLLNGANNKSSFFTLNIGILIIYLIV